VNAEAVRRALARAAGLVEPGDIVNISPSGFGVLKRRTYGLYPCRPLETLAGHGHLLLHCVARAVSARPPVVTTLHFRQVAPRRRGGHCFPDLVPHPATASVVAAPGRPPRVFVYGI